MQIDKGFQQIKKIECKKIGCTIRSDLLNKLLLAEWCNATKDGVNYCYRARKLLNLDNCTLCTCKQPTQ